MKPPLYELHHDDHATSELDQRFRLTAKVSMSIQYSVELSILILTGGRQCEEKERKTRESIHNNILRSISFQSGKFFVDKKVR